MPLTRIFGCKHIEALLNCEILFPNIVQLNNHRRMLRYFYVDLEPWSSTSIQEASSGRSATILRRFMNLEHMCTCGKAKKSSPWDVHVMELPKSKTCLFVGVSNRIAAIINSLKWVQQFELPNKQFAICWASRVTSSVYSTGFLPQLRRGAPQLRHRAIYDKCILRLRKIP